MTWLAVYDADTRETVYVCGYECSNCGYLATRKWEKCPHCHEEWIPESEEERMKVGEVK